MNGKALVMLVLAVVSGLGAMYGTSKLISKERGKVAVDLQDVLVAARDVKNEEVLKPEMVQVVQKPRAEIPPGAFTSYKDVEDRWVQIKILEGEPIVDRKLALKGSPVGLVARIPKGMRAYAVEVSEQSGVSGFILPEHRVDVVQIDSNANGRSDAETILQDVLVLAAGQVFSRPEDRSVQARTITLAVTPDQVNALVAARAKGPLTLSLRGLNDKSVFAKKEAPKKEESPAQVALKINPPTPPPPPPPPPPAPTVAPVAAVTAPAPEQRRARYLTIYKGLERDKRIMLYKPGSTSEDDPGDESTEE